MMAASVADFDMGHFDIEDPSAYLTITNMFSASSAKVDLQ
jgi:hypothetical protein